MMGRMFVPLLHRAVVRYWPPRFHPAVARNVCGGALC